MSRILVVANRTLGSSDLLEAIRDRMTKGPCEFTLLVPATAHAHRESTMETLTRGVTPIAKAPSRRAGSCDANSSRHILMCCSARRPARIGWQLGTKDDTGPGFSRAASHPTAASSWPPRYSFSGFRGVRSPKGRSS